MYIYIPKLIEFELELEQGSDPIQPRSNNISRLEAEPGLKVIEPSPDKPSSVRLHPKCNIYQIFS
jgi:hypothetical protein